ncbi:iron-sulfur cluster assembly protein [Cryptococcus neoformans C23]
MTNLHPSISFQILTLHLYHQLLFQHSYHQMSATMALPAFRNTFASSSRITLHHLPFPSRSLAYLRYGSSLAQHSSSQSYTPTPAYSGPVASSSSSKAKGGVKDMHAAPNPAPPAAPAKSEVTGEKKEPRRRVPLKSQRNAITMTPTAISHLRELLASPTEPRLLRISVKSRGCAGMAYHLDYVPPPGGKFDEVVEQDGVRVLIDSKALFSIIGSRMDWRDNRLSAGFVFDNPNIIDTCGCGESFNIRF